MALEPATGVGEQGETGGVAFGKAVAAEALDLLEDASGEFGGVVPLQHALQQLVAMRFQPAVAFPGRHRTAQLIGLARRVAGGNHCELHHLFLEQRHAERALEHLSQLVWQIVGGFLAAAPAQIRMHHAALDRPGAHDRHLDDQIVELFRLQPRQHRHLRARFDLEHADGVGALDHRVGLRVFGGNGGERVVAAAVRAQQVQGAAQRAEHAQREHVDLHQPDQFQVVLVPLDHRALGHGRVLHRHQGVQRMLGDDEAAGMLRQVPREADQLAGEHQQPAHHRRVRVEAAFAQQLLRRLHRIALAQCG
ncbi:hypothetical protein NB689_003256 [Xanthomonas sacchari]|nr:hypothetical protein [Xanthomonas sacchari]